MHANNTTGSTCGAVAVGRTHGCRDPLVVLNKLLPCDSAVVVRVAQTLDERPDRRLC